MKEQLGSWWLAMAGGFVCLFLLGACSSTGRVRSTAKPTGLELGQFLAKQSQREGTLKEIQGKLQISFSGRKESASGRGRLFLAAPDSGLLEISDPFGRVHFQLLAMGPEVVAHYPRQNQVIVDTTHGKRFLEQLLGVGVSVKELAGFWLGVIPQSLRSQKQLRWEWSEAPGVYVVQGAQWSAEVDGGTAEVVRVRWRSAGDSLFLQYQSFETLSAAEFSRLPLAHVVDGSMETARTSFQIDWSTVAPLAQSAKNKVFRVDIPAGTERLILKP